MTETLTQITKEATQNITCRNRFLGNCPNCEKDYNPDHHPNNEDCPNYKPIIVRYFNVK